MWKLPQPRKSSKVAFGTIFLMISSAAWKTLLGFHSYHKHGGD
jgi:hypothetical protein